jgi:YtkA-like
MNRITLFIATALAVALTAPVTSLAGGWATVGLSSLPEGTQPREVWMVDLTVLQHGRTPLEGVQPRVLIREARGGDEKAFPAKPTERAGVYRAHVAFPSAGRWTYAVDDDFSQVHQLGSVRIGAGGESATAATAAARPTSAVPTDPGDGVTLAGALGIALGAGLLAALFTAALRRRGAPKPAEG